jgi:hypothetical protein
MGIPGYLLNLIISYMTNRRMKVKYNETMSDEQPLPGGSPQGSLLSVIIFCIYTSGCGMKLENQIKEATPGDYHQMPFNQPMRNENQIRLKYIDDTSMAAKIALEQLFQLKYERDVPEFLFDTEHWDGTANVRKFTNFEMTEERNAVHEMIDDVNCFVKLNFMKVNETKTKIMLFNNKKTDGLVTYQSNGKTLEMTDNMKILGFQFQSDMKVSGQVQNMLIKSNKKMCGLRNLIYNGGTRENGNQFYVTWILSLFEYAVPVWHGRLTQHDTDEIEKVQKKYFKIILGKQYINYENAKKIMNLKSMHERREDLCFKFVSKSAKNHPNLYKKKEITRDTRLGMKTPLSVPKFKTELHKKSGKVYLANLYNSRLKEKETTKNTSQAPKQIRKKGRCGDCLKCSRPNCGTSKFCKYMNQFGGPNKLKQACIERKCKI